MKPNIEIKVGYLYEVFLSEESKKTASSNLDLTDGVYAIIEVYDSAGVIRAKRANKRLGNSITWDMDELFRYNLWEFKEIGPGKIEDYPEYFL